ncbi:hypothetical protein E2C01_024969 [Portunus trituberculatus]|uniref:Secreted protein n=1 Tax=Portunus trituberculatus TaxID=210409 RepID=A0A5B7EFB2_PORTR|nr:hypothetical protein [Portunus trituberculatus]
MHHHALASLYTLLYCFSYCQCLTSKLSVVHCLPSEVHHHAVQDDVSYGKRGGACNSQPRAHLVPLSPGLSPRAPPAVRHCHQQHHCEGAGPSCEEDGGRRKGLIWSAVRHSSTVGHSHQVGRIMGDTEVVASCARLSSSGLY